MHRRIQALITFLYVAILWSLDFTISLRQQYLFRPLAILLFISLVVWSLGDLVSELAQVATFLCHILFVVLQCRWVPILSQSPVSFLLCSFITTLELAVFRVSIIFQSAFAFSSSRTRSSTNLKWFSFLPSMLGLKYSQSGLRQSFSKTAENNFGDMGLPM